LDAKLVLLLLLVGVAVKGWLMAHTEIVSRDGIHYIAFAADLGHNSWSATFRNTQQHPLYPIHVLAMTKMVQAVTGKADVFTWQWGAQLANLIAGILLVVPMYYLGKALFNRWTGCGAAALFQCLPVAARVTADALSEGTFLLYGIASLLLAVWALRARSPRWFALSGLTGGLAYLTRPEGAVIVLTAMLMLTAMLFLKTWKRGWWKAGQCAAALITACLIVVGPYWWSIGGLSVKPSVHHMLDSHVGHLQPMEKSHACVATRALFAARLKPGVDGIVEGRVDKWTGLKATLQELSKGFHYVLWAPALIGVFWFRRRVFADPGLALVTILGFAHVAVLWRLASTAGYVSERHTLLVVVCGLMPASALLWAIAKIRLQLRPAQIACVAGLALIGGVSLLKTCQPMHTHRVGHKEAGLWLANRIEPADRLVDPYGWVTFYAGRTLIGVKTIRRPLEAPSSQFLVIEPADRDLSRLWLVKEAEKAANGRGQAVYAWPQNQEPLVVLYQQRSCTSKHAGSCQIE
jgi:hypothetical protein